MKEAGFECAFLHFFVIFEIVQKVRSGAPALFNRFAYHFTRQILRKDCSEAE